MSARILLVEDEPGLVLTLTDRLTAEGYRVESVTNGNVALERASGEAFDIILLDVMLPGRDGFDVCRTLRQRGVSAPIMMLTARGQVVDRVVGLRLGADDYLTKPFEMMELLARVEALLRRAPQSAATASEQLPVRAGARGLPQGRSGEERRNRSSSRHASSSCSATSSSIAARRISRDELLNEVWGYNAMPSTRTVDVHIAWLRQKLEDHPKHPQFILTIHGLGYKFVG